MYKNNNARWMAVWAVFVAGCAPTLVGMQKSPGTADGPGTLWTPERDFKLPPAPPLEPPTLPAGYSLDALKKEGVELTLPIVLDIALASNPVTNSAWANAKEAAARLGVARSDWFPQLNLDAEFTRIHQAAVGGLFSFEISQVTAAIGLNWLLWDFGGRGANIDAARFGLVAANYTQNQAVLDLKLQVEQTYVQFVNARALVQAQADSLAAAQTSLTAAKAREQAGLGTLADVLQAQTAVSQAQLVRTNYEGQVKSLQGALATSMGLPATLALKVKLLPPETPFIDITRKVEPLVERALSQRPDLLAIRAQAAERHARVKAAKSARLPRFVGTGNYTPTYFLHPLQGGRHFVNNYVVGVGMQMPLFTGFSAAYEVDVARAAAEAADAQARTSEQQVTLEVWTAFVELQTAAAQVDNAKDLLASAQASFDVAQGRYREGVGNILDLLVAQRELATARAASVQAQSGWFLAYAELSHAMGGLSPFDRHQAPPKPPEEEAP